MAASTGLTTTGPDGSASVSAENSWSQNSGTSGVIRIVYDSPMFAISWTQRMGRLSLLAFITVAFSHMEARQNKAAPAAGVNLDLLYAGFVGEWVGHIEYRDFGDNSRVLLPTWLEISRDPDGRSLRFAYIYDDGPNKTVKQISLVAIDAAAAAAIFTSRSRSHRRSLQSGRDGRVFPNQFREIDADGKWHGERQEGEGAHYDHPAPQSLQLPERNAAAGGGIPISRWLHLHSKTTAAIGKRGATGAPLRRPAISYFESIATQLLLVPRVYPRWRARSIAEVESAHPLKL